MGQFMSAAPRRLLRPAAGAGARLLVRGGVRGAPAGAAGYLAVAGCCRLLPPRCLPSFLPPSPAHLLLYSNQKKAEGVADASCITPGADCASVGPANLDQVRGRGGWQWPGRQQRLMPMPAVDPCATHAADPPPAAWLQCCAIAASQGRDDPACPNIGAGQGRGVGRLQARAAGHERPRPAHHIP